MEYFEGKKQPLFSELWLEEYGDILLDDQWYGTKMDNFVSSGKAGSTEGSNCRAQDASEDDVVASRWVTAKNQFAGSMMASRADFNEDMLKTLPRGWRVPLKI